MLGLEVLNDFGIFLGKFRYFLFLFAFGFGFGFEVLNRFDSFWCQAWLFGFECLKVPSWGHIAEFN